MTALRPERFPAKLIPAMVTPFKSDLAVDHETLGKLAKHLISHGCDGLLVNGTTGESPTLSLDEKLAILATVQQAVAGETVPIMSGAGSNDTLKSVKEAKALADAGADALLVVVPYYNKPSQAGMIEHFSHIAAAVDTPVVIYNIPGRTGVLMSAPTMAVLHKKFPHIIGVKQSCPDMDAVSEIRATLPESFSIWSGDDSLTLPMMACGAVGVVSVLAHLSGDVLQEMIQAMEDGQLSRARALHLALLKPARDLFKLPNPTLVKSALAKQGLAHGHFRPPMVPAVNHEKAWIDDIFKGVEAANKLL